MNDPPRKDRSRPATARGWVWPLACLVGWGALARAEPFGTPERITDGSLKFRLSRTANGHLAWDLIGTLHVVYWAETRADFTNPTYPSFIIYRSWRPESGWSAPAVVDDSFVAGQRVGGRHPALAVAPDDAVWVVWHDLRHSTAARQWIDNAEIYADRRPLGGSFSQIDLRLTTSMADHAGDNGLAPKIAAAADGRLSVVWFDFHFDDGQAEVPDLFLKTTDADGVFDLSESMAAMRLTNKTERDAGLPYTLPDIDATPDGTRHLVWTGGFGSGVDLFYGAVAAGEMSLTETRLAVGATDFFDPPHIAAGPDGEVWIAWSDKTSGAGSPIRLRRRRGGEADFDPPVTVAAGPGRRLAPDHAIAPDGGVHLVWIEDDLNNVDAVTVRYGRVEPESGVLAEATSLTPERGAWRRPTIALNAEGSVYVLFEEDVNPFNVGDIWFVTNAAPPAINRVPPVHWNARR